MTMTTPQAMAAPGRLDIGRVGSETFGLIRADVAGTYGLAVALGVIPALLGILLTATGAIGVAAVGVNPAAHFFSLGFLLTFVIGLVMNVLIYGSIGYGAVERLQGRKPAIGQQLSAAGAALLPLIGIAILGYIGIVIGTLLFIAPGLFLCTMWSVVLVAAVVDRTGVFASFSRSAALTKNHRWMIFLLIVIFVVIAALLGVVQGTLLLGFRSSGPVAAAVVGSIFGLIIGGAINAVGAVGAGVVYQELRRAKGEFDPGRLAEVFS